MKILQITYSLSSGGAERFVVDLSNELSKNNEVYLTTILDDRIEENSFYKSEISERVKYNSLYQKKGFSFSKLVCLYQFIKSIDPDVVHFQGVNMIRFFLPAIIFNRKPKYIETLHNKAEIIFTFKRLSFITIPIYKLRLVKLCAISKENQDSLKRVCAINDSVLIYNARAFPQASVIFENVKEEIERLKKSSIDRVFIHVGRFSKQKNQEMLVKSFNKLHDKGYNFVLLIFGAGFENADHLKKIANDRIHFLGVRHNITDYLMCADAFCLPSLFEGMPISLIEALYSGCYPICTPVSGPIDIIDNNEIGLVSADFSEDAYVEMLESFFSKYTDVNRTVLQRFAESMFSIERCADKYLSVYNNYDFEK